MDTERCLFVGGQKHGQVCPVPANANSVNTLHTLGDGQDATHTQVTYYRKPFIAGHTRIDTFVIGNPTPAEVLAALAHAAGVHVHHRTTV